MMNRIPEDITICNLKCLLMPNGEVISLGRTVGWFDKYKNELTPIKDGITGETLDPKEYE